MFAFRWRGWGNPWHVFRPSHRYSRFRQGLSRRGAGLPEIGSDFHGAGRNPVRHTSKAERARGLRSRGDNSAILAIPFLAAMTLAGCRSPAIADPKPVYQSIHSDFLRGNLAGAQQNAEKAV